jgi:hypothetical protein
MRDAGFGVAVPVVTPAVPNERCSALLPACGLALLASSEREFGDLANTRVLATRQISIKITQVGHRNFTHPSVTRPVTISGNAGDDAQRYQEKAVTAAIAEAAK